MSLELLQVMELPEKLSLHWSDFDINLRSSFASLRKEEHFSDVTLVSEDGQAVKAHRLLLSASSPLLDHIMKLQDHPKPIIFLRGTNMDALDSLVDFIYHGEVEVPGDQLDAFLALANDLKVKGLSKEVSLIEKSLNTTEKYAKPAAVDASEVVNYTTAEEEKRISNVKDQSQQIIEIRNLYNCNWCAMTSISPKGLEKHKHRKHPNEKGEPPVVVSTKSIDGMFRCRLCDKLSVSKVGLQKHKTRKHKRRNRQYI